MAKRMLRRRRNNKMNSKRGRPANRRYATRVLATGVGAVTRKAFGSTRGHTLQCWDAKHPHHLPLPRAVGPYTTIRATRRVQVSAIANVIGTYQSPPTAATSNWSEIVMLSDVNVNNPINGGNNAQATTVDLGGLGDAATLVPSAMTVQLMCPTALQTASGIIYAGVMNTQAALNGRTESWASYMDKFVQFQSPRLLAASKLALRGVQISSYPLNMSEVSQFTQLKKEADGVFTYDTSDFSPRGWAPIIIYNPNQATLELLITVEYRVRFDLDHPASASHIHHPVATDTLWDKLTKGASSLGHGVMDIAEMVANAGATALQIKNAGSELAALAM